MRFLLLLLVTLSLSALEIDGVRLPPTALLAGQEVPLRGADLLRWKWVVKIYVAAAWLPPGEADPRTVVPARLGFTYRRGFSAEDLAKATTATIAAGRDAAAMAALQPHLTTWNAAYPAVVEGDVLTIDHLPGGLLVLTVNGQERCRIEDEAFAQAVIGIWVGPDAFDADLRAAMLARPASD